MERNSRDGENKREQMTVGFIVSGKLLMYTTAVLQRKFIQTFLLPPPPSVSPSPSSPLSVSLLLSH